MTNYQPGSEYICRVINLVAELAQEQDGAVLCHPQEPIVRCKDCRFYIEDESACWYFGHCEIVCFSLEMHPSDVEVEPDGFCAWGEPREGSEQ